MSRATSSLATAELAVPRRLLLTYIEEAQAQLARRREIVGDRIREARNAKGWLQKELARRVHVEPQTVSNWERGVSTPDLDKLDLLAEVLEQPVSYFLVSPAEDPPEPAGPIAERLAGVEAELAALRGEIAGLVSLLQPEDDTEAPRRRA
jgi:transcriptional regulator with XRE-family HTH domain